MPSTNIHHHPQGYTIVFEEESHTYTTDLKTLLSPKGGVLRRTLLPDGSFGNLDFSKGEQAVVRYVSGTTFVHKFFPVFDPDGKILEQTALKRGVSADQIKFEWKQKALQATTMGTRVHETCEDILHGQTSFRNTPQSDHERNLMSAGWQACQWILQNYDILGIEKMVGDIDIQIAGTIDLLAKRKSDGRMTIFDWKTNAKIDFDNRYRTGQYALAPIQHLKNCSAVHYSLQLSLYEFILKKAGYVQSWQSFDRAIIHLTDDGPKFYPLPDRGIEIRDMVIRMMEQAPF